MTDADLLIDHESLLPVVPSTVQLPATLPGERP